MSQLGSVIRTFGREGVGDGARRETETLEGTAPFRWLVRAGFVARGITYGVIGALALALAVGAGTMGTAPDQQGALALVGRTPLGRAALVVICAGLLAYAVWKLTQGILGRGPEGGGGVRLTNRVSNVAGGVVYVGFFAVAVRAVIGSGGNSSRAATHAAAGVLGWPAGRLIVGTAGAGFVAISLYQLFDALTGRFTRDLKTDRMGRGERRLVGLLGRAGLTARAVVFCLVGYFLLRTAINYDPRSAVGVDGALARLHNEPLGPWLLGLVAAGLLTFAAFSLLEGRYRRL